MGTEEKTENKKLGLVGCGMMGSRYAKVFGDMEGMEIVACCDPTPAKLDSFRSRTGIKKGFSDYNEMLETASFDALLNVTYDPLHIPVLKTALEHNLPVLTEKPLGISVEECRLLDKFSPAVLNGVTVNFSKRNTGALRAAKELIANSCLGDIISIDASYRQGWILTKEWGDWHKERGWLWRLDAAFSPLGAFSDLGSHLLDTIFFITDQSFTSLACTESLAINKGPIIKGHKLDSSDLLIVGGNLESGVPVQMLASRVDAGETDRLCLTINGERAALHLDLTDSRHSVKIFPLEETVLPLGFGDIAIPEPGAWKEIPYPKPRNIYREFAASLLGEQADCPGLNDAMKVQSALEAIRMSREESGRKVAISEVAL